MFDLIIKITATAMIAIVALIYMCSYIQWRRRLRQMDTALEDKPRKRWIEYPDRRREIIE